MITMISSKLKTAAIYQPITLAEGKSQLNIETAFTDDDVIIASCIKQAVSYFMNRTSRQLIQATWQAVLSDWPSLFELPIGPVVEVSSVKYYDTANALQTLATTEYNVNLLRAPATINLTGTLPGLYDRDDAIIIEYIAGEGIIGASEAAQQAAVTDIDKAVIKILMTNFYETRDGNFSNNTVSVLNSLMSERRLFTSSFNYA